MLLFLLPFYDRGPERHPLRRPTAMIAMFATIAAMAYLTVMGALAGPPSEIDLKVAARYQPGKEVVAANGCLGCHKIGENGNTLGPNLTQIGDRLGKDAIARTLVNPTKPMPSYIKLQKTKPKQFNDLVEFVASLRKDMSTKDPKPSTAK
jgi:mono/diheme cytochrome c family protein